MDANYLLPPILRDHTGQARRAGFEFEFGNLPIVETARALQHSLGGELEIKSPFEAVLRDSLLGKLKVERDADLLKSVKYRKWLENLGIEFTPGSFGHGIETNIDSVSRILIPCEVITDPIPFKDLPRLNTLVEVLNRLGAEGTQDSLIYAFGLHINPSIADNSSASLRRYIQAFLLLQAWIIESSGIDITRRFLTKYIDPFPPAYMELVLDNNYQPDSSQLIADYMTHNPTRNRALDMLPIFCELDEKQVFDGVREEDRKLLKGRPAFHYRLPDCKINVPGWSTADPWNQWVYIETLATEQKLLNELIDAWCENTSTFSLAPNSSWVLRLTTILSQKFFSRKDGGE
jgi:hypothetical protein